MMTHRQLLLGLGLILIACKPSRRPIDSFVTDDVKAESNTEPKILIIDFPDQFSREKSVEIRLEGQDIVAFRYKVTNSVARPCTSEDGYSPEQDMVPEIILDVSEFADGELLFCAIGKNSAGNWQPFFKASQVAWLKKTNGPKPVSDLTFQEGQVAFELEWGVAEDASVEAIEFLVFRSQVPVEEPLLEDGRPHGLGDTVGDMTLLYRGSDPVFVDREVNVGQDYFYYIFAADELLNYSIPTHLNLRSFGVPYAWESSGQAAEVYAQAISAGSQPDGNGGADELFICRADFGDASVRPGQLVPGPGGDLGQGTCRSLGPDGNGGLTGVEQANYEVLIQVRNDFDTYFIWDLVNFDPNQQQMIPPRGLKAGANSTGGALYICRGAFGNRPRPGHIGDDFARCSAVAVDEAGTDQAPTFDAWQVLSLRDRASLSGD